MRLRAIVTSVSGVDVDGGLEMPETCTWIRE
jgi:hypothetical protein